MLDPNDTDPRSPNERNAPNTDHAVAASGSPNPFPDRRYAVILADPPWSYYGDPNKDQAAGKHYDLMSTADIAALPVRSITAPSAALFLWATGPRLPEAVKVMEAWGFHYRGAHSVWVKTARDGRIINGQGVRPTFTKPTTEFLLVGSTCRRGRPLPIVTEAQSQVVLSPRGRHSEKPAVFRRRIVELLGDVPRIELFARERVDGWDAWGNELQEPTRGSEQATSE
jgi:Transcriptional activator, adenine-specific DNA methyltransferase